MKPRAPNTALLAALAEKRDLKAKAREQFDSSVRRAWEESHSIYEVRMALGVKEGMVTGALQRLGLYVPAPNRAAGSGRKAKR